MQMIERPIAAGPPLSAFQKKIRGSCSVLRDHICKQMNELNLERCRCIPKEVPGADWRCLEQLVAQDPARELYQASCRPTMLCLHTPPAVSLEAWLMAAAAVGNWKQASCLLMAGMCRAQQTCVCKQTRCRDACTKSLHCPLPEEGA